MVDPLSQGLDAYPRVFVESLLEKVLASAVFKRSERHRRLLRHIVGAALDGRVDRLKEVLIGIELFGRRIDRYDPRTDPIVRVEVGRVREKLARYYASDGAADPCVFSIPVGGYAPHLEPLATVQRPVESFAVLPFSSGSAEQDVSFAIGLADQLIDRLGRVRDLKVVARLSAYQARDAHLDIRDIGKLLKVTRVIDGSIQRQGTRIRCFAEICDAKDGTRLWSQVFDSGYADRGSDLFVFQDRIVDSVLDVVVSASARDGLATKPATTPATTTPVDDPLRRMARDLLERASYLSRRFDAATADKSTALFEKAVELDPDNTRALVALATAYLDQVSLMIVSTEAMLPRIVGYVDRALAIDPTDAEALGLRASIVCRLERDLPRGLAMFADALQRAPNAAGVNSRYAFVLLYDGRFEAGLTHLRFAMELDPLNLRLRASRVHCLAYARDYDGAEREARVILELEPGHLYMHIVLGLLHVYRGEADAALRAFDVVIAALPGHPAAHFMRICGRGVAGDIALGRRELVAALSRFDGRFSSAYTLAMAELSLGDVDACLVALARAARERDILFCTLPVDPLFVPLHDDPRFLALLADHGLRSPVS